MSGGTTDSGVMRDVTETIVIEYFRPELADHLLDMGLPAGGSLLDVELPD